MTVNKGPSSRCYWLSVLELAVGVTGTDLGQYSQELVILQQLHAKSVLHNMVDSAR